MAYGVFKQTKGKVHSNTDLQEEEKVKNQSNYII